MGRFRAAPAVTEQVYRFFGSYRFVLALMVLFSHISAWLGDGVQRMALGSVGVFSFFVLSGFVIAEALDVFYRGAIWRFAVNRVLKIYPAFWIVALLTVAIELVGGGALSWNLTAFLANLTIILSFFKFANNTLLISGGWAVIIELVFYATFALVWWCAHRTKRPGLFLSAAALVFVFLYGVIAARGDYGHSYSNLRYAPQFVLGAALYWAVIKRHAFAACLAGLSCLFALHSYWIYVNAGSSANSVQSLLLFGISISFLIVLANLRVPVRLKRVDRRLGDMTYALYLVNGLVIAIATEMAQSSVVRFALVLILGIGLSLIISQLAEHPLRRWRTAIRGRSLDN
jgi:peptidoglycan/LPS O-acetylase OafA/YrhL